MDTTNEQVKDAAEALVQVIKEITIEVDSTKSTNHHHQEQHLLLQQNIDMIVDAIENSNEVTRGIVDESTKVFQAKMDDINQQIDSTKEIIKLHSDMVKASNEEMNTNVLFASQHLTSLQDEIKAGTHLSQSIRDTHTEVKEEIHSMNQHLTKLQSDMSSVKNLLETQEKQRKIEFQISCADVISFTYYKGFSYEEQDSSDLVRKILVLFALGRKVSISPNYTTLKSSEKRRGRKDFREKLKEQLEFMMGHEPTIIQEDDGWFAFDDATRVL